MLNNLPPNHNPDAQSVTFALDLLGNWGQWYNQQNRTEQKNALYMYVVNISVSVFDRISVFKVYVFIYTVAIDLPSGRKRLVNSMGRVFPYPVGTQLRRWFPSVPSVPYMAPATTSA